MKKIFEVLRKTGLSIFSLYCALSAIGYFLGGNFVEGTLMMVLAFLIDNKVELLYIKDKLEAKNGNSCCKSE